MPTASKVLVAFFVMLTLCFVWLSASVLELRSRWDSKVRAKAQEVAKLQNDIHVLTRGAPDLKEEFTKKVAEPVLQNASAAAREEHKKKLNAGFDPQAAFQSAMTLYIDSRTLENYRDALRRLNDVQKTAPPDEIARGEASKAFDTADNEFQTAQRNLDAAYRTYMGLEAGQGGVRDVLNKMSVSDLRSTLIHIRHVTAAQRTVHNTIYSDGQKNLTQIKDLWLQAAAEAATLRAAADNGMRERDELIKEHDQTNTELQRERVQLAFETEKRDKAIAELNDLKERFEKTHKSARHLAMQIKVMEYQIDRKRGLSTAVISSDGLIPQGKVQNIDEQSGTLTINLGTRLGVQPGMQLHVYRFGDNARYLGMLTVVRAESNSAVARMLPEYRQVPVQAGDLVGPEILPEQPLAKTQAE